MAETATHDSTRVPVVPVSPGLFREVLSDTAFRELSTAVVTGRELLSGKVVWNINSTAHGGGVAEMLESLVSYACGAGIDTRWYAIHGAPQFFKITKRIHNQIQGFEGDGGELGDTEHGEYAQSLAGAGRELATMVRPGDIVLLHDPQTAGLVNALKEAGAWVVWRCHVGMDRPNELAAAAWVFLTPYLEKADAYVFSRASFAWKDLRREKVVVIPPSIDPFSAKNNLLTRARAGSILMHAGLLRGYAATAPYFIRRGGGLSFVSRHAEVAQLTPLLPVTRVVTQVSRWDRLKDPIGVMTAFAQNVPASSGAHLMLAGPEVAAVSDDPEGADVLNRCIEEWKGLPENKRARIHLACLPMTDLEENAAIVNALQRWSEVVVQKSLAEGFGLTVAEAMWKAKPVVASRIGGIQDQIEDQRSGVLLDDPSDLAAFGRIVSGLLADPARARQLGAAAQERVKAQFLNDRHLEQYVDLFSQLIA